MPRTKQKQKKSQTKQAATTTTPQQGPGGGTPPVTNPLPAIGATHSLASAPAQPAVASELRGQLVRLRAQAQGAEEADLDRYELHQAIKARRPAVQGGSDAQIAEEPPQTKPAITQGGSDAQIAKEPLQTNPATTIATPVMANQSGAVVPKQQASEDDGWETKSRKPRERKAPKTDEQMIQEGTDFVLRESRRIIGDQNRWSYKGPSVYVPAEYRPFSADIRQGVIDTLSAEVPPPPAQEYYFPGANKSSGKGTKGKHNFNISGHSSTNIEKSKTLFQVHIIFE